MPGGFWKVLCTPSGRDMMLRTKALPPQPDCGRAGGDGHCPWGHGRAITRACSRAGARPPSEEPQTRCGAGGRELAHVCSFWNPKLRGNGPQARNEAAGAREDTQDGRGKKPRRLGAGSQRAAGRRRAAPPRRTRPPPGAGTRGLSAALPSWTLEDARLHQPGDESGQDAPSGPGAGPAVTPARSLGP